MNFNSICPLCQNSDFLKSFNWGSYKVIHCMQCQLDYCGEMVEKEFGGDSSPVTAQGVEMMSNSFHKTNQLANAYARKRKNIYESLLENNCKSIIEVGCGPGVFYKPYKKLNVKWVGVDINPYWKSFGEKNDVPISNASIDSITEKYDVVLAYQVIEHVEDPVTFMNSLKSLLNPGGVVHLELPNQNSFTSRLRKISSIISHDYGFIQPPMHLRAFRKSTVEYLFNKLNLKTRKLFVCGNTNNTWGQVREYSTLQKSLYTITGKIGLGSLLIGIAQLDL